MRGQKTDRDIKELIIRLRRNNSSIGPTAILEKIKEGFPDKSVPSYRTIQNILNGLKDKDINEPWVFRSKYVEEDKLIIETLSAIIYSTRGAKRWISVEEGDIILWVRGVAPDLDPWKAWIVVRSYIMRHQRKEAVIDLDYYLAFAPWRGIEANQRYEYAISCGWVERPSSWELSGLFEAGFGEWFQDSIKFASQEWEKEKQILQIIKVLKDCEHNLNIENINNLKNSLLILGKSYKDLDDIQSRQSRGDQSLYTLFTIVKTDIEKDIKEFIENNNLALSLD